MSHSDFHLFLVCGNGQEKKPFPVTSICGVYSHTKLSARALAARERKSLVRLKVDTEKKIEIESESGYLRLLYY
jgi:hypothetical protein